MGRFLNFKVPGIFGRLGCLLRNCCYPGIFYFLNFTVAELCGFMGLFSVTFFFFFLFGKHLQILRDLSESRPGDEHFLVSNLLVLTIPMMVHMPFLVSTLNHCGPL